MFPIRPLSAIHQNKARQKIETAFLLWSIDWLGQSATFSLEISPASDINLPRTGGWFAVGGTSAYLHWDTGSRKRLLRMMSGEIINGPLPEALSRWSELAAESLMGKVMGGNPRLQAESTLPEDCTAHYAGYLSCVLTAGELVMRLVINAFAIDAELDSHPPGKRHPKLSPRSDAISEAPVELNVQLRDAVIPIQQLFELAVGDVLELEHQLDSPLVVMAPGNVLLGHAYLGQLGGIKAITPTKPI